MLQLHLTKLLVAQDIFLKFLSPGSVFSFLKEEIKSISRALDKAKSDPMIAEAVGIANIPGDETRLASVHLSSMEHLLPPLPSAAEEEIAAAETQDRKGTRGDFSGMGCSHVISGGLHATQSLLRASSLAKQAWEAAVLAKQAAERALLSAQSASEVAITALEITGAQPKLQMGLTEGQQESDLSADLFKPIQEIAIGGIRPHFRDRFIDIKARQRLWLEGTLLDQGSQVRQRLLQHCRSMYLEELPSLYFEVENLRAVEHQNKLVWYEEASRIYNTYLRNDAELLVSMPYSLVYKVEISVASDYGNIAESMALFDQAQQITLDIMQEKVLLSFLQDEQKVKGDKLHQTPTLSLKTGPSPKDALERAVERYEHLRENESDERRKSVTSLEVLKRLFLNEPATQSSGHTETSTENSITADSGQSTTNILPDGTVQRTFEDGPTVTYRRTQSIAEGDLYMLQSLLGSTHSLASQTKQGNTQQEVHKGSEESSQDIYSLWSKSSIKHILTQSTQSPTCYGEENVSLVIQPENSALLDSTSLCQSEESCHAPSAGSLGVDTAPIPNSSNQPEHPYKTPPLTPSSSNHSRSSYDKPARIPLSGPEIQKLIHLTHQLRGSLAEPSASFRGKNGSAEGALHYEVLMSENRAHFFHSSVVRSIDDLDLYRRAKKFKSLQTSRLTVFAMLPVVANLKRRVVKTVPDRTRDPSLVCTETAPEGVSHDVGNSSMGISNQHFSTPQKSRRASGPSHRRSRSEPRAAKKCGVTWGHTPVLERLIEVKPRVQKFVCIQAESQIHIRTFRHYRMSEVDAILTTTYFQQAADLERTHAKVCLSNNIVDSLYLSAAIFPSSLICILRHHVGFVISS